MKLTSPRTHHLICLIHVLLTPAARITFDLAVSVGQRSHENYQMLAVDFYSIYYYYFFCLGGGGTNKTKQVL